MTPERDTPRLRELVADVPAAIARVRDLEDQFHRSRWSNHPTLDPATVDAARRNALTLALELACLADLETMEVGA